MSALGSALTLSTIAFGSKILLKSLTKRFDVRGLPILLDALKEPNLDLTYRRQDQDDELAARTRDWKGKGKEIDSVPRDDHGKPMRRGIVTVCNHNSVVDDPTMWSMLPLNHFMPFAGPSRVKRFNRWTLGASDIMFTNKPFSSFFRAGQVIETVRGGGIFQPAVDQAIKLVQEGEWIHIFPEGKINQETINPPGGLMRFKWGVGRIIMDSTVMPEIIPMWISGFDTVMPETRGWPRPIPRPGGNISITIGEPLTSAIEPLVNDWRRIAATQQGTVGVGGEWRQEGGGEGATPDAQQQRGTREQGLLADGKEKEVRIKIVDILQEAVRKLGVEVETAEGRFEKKETWSHSTRLEDRVAKSASSPPSQG